MANWCNNYLEVSTKNKPLWINAPLEGDDALPLPEDDHYAFGTDITCIKGNKCWITTMSFQTKWSPPIDFYEHLRNNCLSIYADYSEPGSEIYGKFDENGHEKCSCPLTYYSKILDTTIHLTNPSQLFMDVVQDEYVLFEDYLKELYMKIVPNQNELLIQEEIEECAQELHINLEDQQWVELVASITP